MKTEAKFKKALRDMMLSVPLEDINVTALCKKCGCHRQTFYYHFQDIYDLLAAYFLNESVKGLQEAEELDKALDALIGYSKDNFLFLKSSYNSAAHDLVDDFFFNKLVNKAFNILTSKNNYRLSTNGYRAVARRYSRLVADEFGYYFKDPSMTAQKFEKGIKRFAKASLLTVFPAMISLSKEEKKK